MQLTPCSCPWGTWTPPRPVWWFYYLTREHTSWHMCVDASGTNMYLHSRAQFSEFNKIAMWYLQLLFLEHLLCNTTTYYVTLTLCAREVLCSWLYRWANSSLEIFLWFCKWNALNKRHMGHPSQACRGVLGPFHVDVCAVTIMLRLCGQPHPRWCSKPSILLWLCLEP